MVGFGFSITRVHFSQYYKII